jgi:hypothetical protein
MSDTTFRPALTSSSRTPMLALLRAGVRRLRTMAEQVADTVETYSLIEGTCLVTAAGFGLTFVIAGFGLHL